MDTKKAVWLLRVLFTLPVVLGITACMDKLVRPSDTTENVTAQGNPSPIAGSSVSQRANRAAGQAAYQAIEYTNASKKGPGIIVLPGDIKSSNVTFTQKYGPTNIADFGELELSKANFSVLERSDLGSLLREFEVAYNLGDQEAARHMLEKGKLKSTRWIAKFDVLKAEPVAKAANRFDGQTMGSILSMLAPGTGGSVAGTAVGSVKQDEAAAVWLVGMRYKIIDANTTEQVANNYIEEKMEIGAKATSVLGISSSAEGQTTLDTLVQRLVQRSVAEIDAKYK